MIRADALHLFATADGTCRIFHSVAKNHLTRRVFDGVCIVLMGSFVHRERDEQARVLLVIDAV